MHTLNDTGTYDYAIPFTTPLNPNGERALRACEARLDKEIALGALYHESLCRHADRVFERLLDDLQSRRQVREVLWMRGVFEDE